MKTREEKALAACKEYDRQMTVGGCMITLIHGDCIERLKRLPDNSVDSVVTDPPYGLSFMGKKWDYDVPSVEVWAECLRVLKPGGHLLAFAGTRTQHRMACRIEDAGFEIRDMIAWVYGSGFPKSMDVSKAIDKAGPLGQVPFAEFAAHYEDCRKAKGMTHAAVCSEGGWFGAVNHGGSSVNWANGYGIPTAEQWDVLQPMLGLDDCWKELVERVQYEREVLGIRHGTRLAVAPGQDNDRSGAELVITAAGSAPARQWQGWGTALKPALEPITVARKPLIGTVAANVLQHGTGAINVDGCRVPSGPDHAEKCASVVGLSSPGNINTFAMDGRPREDSYNSAGRWPANLIHDGSDEVLAGFPDSNGAGGSLQNAKITGYGDGIGNGKSDYFGGERTPFNIGKGSAARFFYCAKASKRDRGDGNNHPTVKPTDLMRYLCRMVTTAGGTVLDPFMGSGSTGKAAVLEGFNFIGMELSEEYLSIAHARIESAKKNDVGDIQPDLFGCDLGSAILKPVVTEEA